MQNKYNIRNGVKCVFHAIHFDYFDASSMIILNLTIILGTEMSTSYTFTLFGRTVKKNGRKSIEKTKDKSSTQENSFESTNGE